MLLIRCPYCGPRPEIEFAYGGEAHIARPQNPALVSDDQWAEFLFFRSNSKGLHYERWCHTHGCARFFNAVRHTVGDQFLIIYEIGKPKPSLLH
jgi:sarcosine oxidase, subunit delta